MNKIIMLRLNEEQVKRIQKALKLANHLLDEEKDRAANNRLLQYIEDKKSDLKEQLVLDEVSKGLEE